MFHCHESLATRAIISHLIGSFKRQMASEKETTVTFTRACPVNPSCLGMCSRVRGRRWELKGLVTDDRANRSNN